jgi:ribosomal protein L11 methyltransferase
MYIWRKRATADWLRGRSDELILRFGAAVAIVERPAQIRTLVEIACGTRKAALDLVREFGGTIEKLRPDWLANFARRSNAKPLRIGSRVVVRRSRSGTADSSIIIPAEAAFGTGEHATTAMCLRLLERTTRRRAPDWTMLDAGTGSGILAIAGSRFGAARVLAIDNDPLACAIAARNARANHVRNIEFRTGDVLKPRPKGKFDIIMANLFSEILIAALPTWSRQLANEGCLILSGILRAQEKSITAALRRNGFAAQEVKRRGNWIALLAVRRTARKAVPT